MKTQIFTDKNDEQLIIKHRKSAVFFEREADIEKPNKYGDGHSQFVCISELSRHYEFDENTFAAFSDYCELIAIQSWSLFEPKEATSWGSDYDDYYDKEFDNNGSLSVRANGISIEGPYAQPKTNGKIVRLIKFDKRRFESFIHELLKRRGE